jgi:ABC-2 type transport system ATP-binding protein
MIIAKQICKKYGKHTVLDKLDFNVKKGSIYGLVGPNGAGKTTLLRILAGIMQEDSGEIRIFDENVFENAKNKARISFIPDDLFFFGQANILDMAKFYRMMYPTWDEDRFQRLAQIFALPMNKRIGKLSKGMKRQVAFWMSLSLKPDLMILDEPLDGLDPLIRTKVKRILMAEVAEREMSVVISSHNLRELEDICDAVGILHNGSIMLERDLDALKSGVVKVQIAFAGAAPEALFTENDIMYQETRGSIQLLILRGEIETIRQTMASYSPLLVDILPLTLEEIFVYEMGGAGYDIKTIL